MPHQIDGRSVLTEAEVSDLISGLMDLNLSTVLDRDESLAAIENRLDALEAAPKKKRAGKR